MSKDYILSFTGCVSVEAESEEDAYKKFNNLAPCDIAESVEEIQVIQVQEVEA